jgi:hypothetical protein
MYRRPKFLEVMDEIREQMSRESDYDVDLFAQRLRNGDSDPGTSKLLEKAALGSIEPDVIVVDGIPT